MRGLAAGLLGGMLALLLIVAAGIPGAGSADAFWRSIGQGMGSALTGTLNPPTAVTVAATSGSSVAVSWTASAGSTVPTGYFVTRTSGGTTVAACGSSPTVLVTATSCTDPGVATGSYTYRVTAVFRSWTAASAPSGTVVVTAATRLAFSTQPTNAVAGVGITPAISVALQNAASGAVAVAGVPITLAIGTNPGGGTLSGTVTAVTNSSGVATFAGLSIDKVGNGYTLAASSTGLTSATSNSFAISAAVASRLAFTSTPVTATASTTTNAAITVQRQDAFGNPVTSGTASTLTLGSSSVGPVVFAPTTGAAASAPVVIAAGASSVTFFYGDTKVGTPAITAAFAGLTSATQIETITANGTTKLVFTSATISAAASATTNSGPITVQRLDALNNPAPVGPATTLTLASNSTGTAVFAPTSGAAAATVQFAAGSSTATFFYGDTKAGSPVITATLAGSGSVAQTETITPAAASKLVFTSASRSAPASATTNGTAIAVQRQDQFGNPVPVAVSTTLTLSSNSGTGFFAPGTAAAATPVAFAAGASTATFYYGDTKVGSPTITATQGALATATQAETVTIGTVILTFGPQPMSIRSGAPFPSVVAVSAADAFGNVSSGTVVSLSLSGPFLALGQLTLNGSATTSVSVTTNALGVATFPGISVTAPLPRNGFTLQASATGSTTVSSASFNLIP